jgi:hypothetical protein
LSRRLGDDPLTRAKNEKARAAQSSASSQPETKSSSHASYNDVFFERRSEGIARGQAARARATREPSEISEISEIPEIREVAAAPAVQSGFNVTGEVRAAVARAEETAAPPAPQVSIIAEAVATLNRTVTVPAVQVDAVPQVKAETPAISQGSAGSKVEPKPEAQKSGGFFKRLFGKFK